MITWNFKPALTLIGCLFAAGCAGNAVSFASKAPVEEARVTQIDLAGGAVTLTAPPGYCIDTRTMHRARTKGFALMARCDTNSGRARALITVATAPRDTDASLDINALVAAVQPSDIRRKTEIDGLPLVQVAGDSAPNESLSTVHWRSAFVLNGQMVALALYAPEHSSALGDSGARILADCAARTRENTEKGLLRASESASSTPRDANSTKPSQNKFLLTPIAALFE